MKYLILLFIIFVILYYIYLIRSKSVYNQNVEHFIDKNQDDDIFDREYVDIYDIAFNDFNDIKMDFVSMKDANIFNNEDRIAILGCGVGKLGRYLKENHPKIGELFNIDKSTNMCRKAQKNYPDLKYINGNASGNSKLLDNNSFNIIIIDERMMLYNDYNEQMQIIINSYDWLKEGGYLVVPIYKKGKIGLACRFYSTNYADNLGNIHGFTYLNQFTHDCWYQYDIKNSNTESYNTEYYEKITLENQNQDRDRNRDQNRDQNQDRDPNPNNLNIRVFKQNMYILDDNVLYDIILKSGFEVFKIYDTEKRIIGGYQLAIFKKKSGKIII